jgi:hypothetical protein
METKKQSPRIEHLSWGTIEVEGGKSYKDAKLFPGGSREWDWKETGTSHEGGVLPADVEELLDKGATVVIVGKGINGRLDVNPATQQLLKERGIHFHALPTKTAVELYNELREKEDIAGLFHSTC